MKFWMVLYTKIKMGLIVFYGTLLSFVNKVHFIMSLICKRSMFNLKKLMGKVQFLWII